MSKDWANFKRIRLIPGQAHPLLKTVVGAAVVLSAAALISIRMVQWDTWDRIGRLEERAAALTAENAQLQERIDALGTADSIRRIAGEELGMVDPGTIVIDSE